MYNTWIPIHGKNLNHETRETFLAYLRRAECTRIVIVAHEVRFIDDDTPDPAYDALCNHIAFFQKNGIETGIWIGTTIGHGELLAHEAAESLCSPYTPLSDLNGNVLSGTRCPLDPAFQRDFASYVARLGRTGATTILLDDDFRLSRRANGGFFCACDRHMADMERRLRESGTPPISRKEFLAAAFSGKPNAYRDAWLASQGDSLKALASALRDATDPSVRIALCTVHSHLDIDGVDGLTLTRILTGKNPPLLRTHGAPYWPVLSKGKDLPATLEIARMFASFSAAEDVELIAEGDVYPRPAYNVPASYLELFDAVMRADTLHHGILKYMFDYCASPAFETTYLEHHENDLPLLKKVTERFSCSTPVGVRVHIAPHTLKNADLDLDPAGDQTPYPSAGLALQHAGVPTVYRGQGFTDAAFGEAARTLDADALQNGLFLDASAAVILTERGIDVGLSAPDRSWHYTETSVSALKTHDPEEYATIWGGGGRMLDAILRDSAEVLLYALANGKELPLLYRYENENGKRFLVTLISGRSFHGRLGIPHSYLYGALLKKGLEWITRAPLPLLLPRKAGLYTIAAQKGSTQLLLLCNCSADELLSPTVTFDRPVTAASASESAVHTDGNRIVFEQPLPAFRFTLVEAET